MKVHRFQTDIEKMKEEAAEILRTTKDQKFKYKTLAVLQVLNGTTAYDLSKIYPEAANTISGWVKKADEEGFDSLKTYKAKGQPPKLTQEQIDQIDKILQSDPEEYGYLVWTGASVSDLIKEMFDVEYGVRACQKLFKKLGYSYIRPQIFPSKGNADEKARGQYKKNCRKH